MKVRGFTLIELLIGVCIAVILLGVTAPSFVTPMATMRLEGVLGSLSVDLQYARSQSIREQRAVTLAVNAAGDRYTISDANGTLKTVVLPAGITLTPSVTVSFDALRGMASAASIAGRSSATSGSLRVSTNAMGRAQLCSPSGSMSGYPSC